MWCLACCFYQASGWPGAVSVCANRHSGAHRKCETQMCNCTSGNLEIPGSLISLAPRNDGLARIIPPRAAEHHAASHTHAQHVYPAFLKIEKMRIEQRG